MPFGEGEAPKHKEPQSEVQLGHEQTIASRTSEGPALIDAASRAIQQAQDMHIPLDQSANFTKLGLRQDVQVGDVAMTEKGPKVIDNANMAQYYESQRISKGTDVYRLSGQVDAPHDGPSSKQAPETRSPDNEPERTVHAPRR